MIPGATVFDRTMDTALKSVCRMIEASAPLINPLMLLLERYDDTRRGKLDWRILRRVAILVVGGGR